MTPQLAVGFIALLIMCSTVIGVVAAAVILWWTKSQPGEATELGQLQAKVDRLERWRSRIEVRLDAEPLSRTRPRG